MTKIGYETDQENDFIKTNETTSTIVTMLTGGIYLSKINSIANETALRTSLIIKDPSICQGKAIIIGTRIAVLNIVELHYLLDWGIKKIQEEYPQLDEQKILAALEYYESHMSEIDSLLKEEKEIRESNWFTNPLP